MKILWPNDKQHLTHIWATALIELSLSRGARLEPLLRGTGLFKQDLTKSDHFISATQLSQLITNCQKQTRSHDLSFMLGRRLLKLQSSNFSQLIENARDLRQAAQVFQLYQSQLFPFVFGEVKRFQGDVYFILNPALMSDEQQFMFEVLCAAVYHSSKNLCGKLIPYSFNFEMSRPRNIYQFEENLGRRLSFSQPLNWIKIETRYLTSAIQPAQSFTRVNLLVQSRKLRLDNNGVASLRYIYKALLSGSVANLEQVAELLNTSPATLKRKLKNAGVSFQQLQDSVRKQQAVFELAVCGQNNGEVAKKLKFSDVTNFRRAFKRWTGLTPAQLKAD